MQTGSRLGRNVARGFVIFTLFSCFCSRCWEGKSAVVVSDTHLKNGTWQKNNEQDEQPPMFWSADLSAQGLFRTEEPAV